MPGIGITGGRFGGGGLEISVSVALSNSTPKYDETITITATATGATSYSFYLPVQDGSTQVVTQASNTYNWKVKKYDAFNVVVTATDGSASGVGSASGTTTGDTDASAFITAHNAATGGTMDATMQDNTLGFFLRLKGINTTIYEDVFAQLLAANAELYPMIPDDVSGASVAGYSINAIDPSRNATMVGFVPADATVGGLQGGTGKYLILNNAPSDYGEFDVGVDAYAIGNTANNTYHIGSTDASGSSVSLGATNFGKCIFLANQLSHVPQQRGQANEQGVYSLQKNSEPDFPVLCYIKGSMWDYNRAASIAPSTDVFFGMALNNNGTATGFLTAKVSMLCNRAYLTENQYKTFVEAVDWLQAQIGRNV